MTVRRSGRKHRAFLRAGVRKDLRDPETGRLLKYKSYVNRQLLVMTGGTVRAPVLEWMLYDDIAERSTKRDLWVSRIVRRFGREADLEQRCWLSGVQLYFVPYSVVDDARKTVWGVSREHLVCERNGGKGHGDSNIAFAGTQLNARIGHNPLPLKLLVRQELAKHSYNRDDPTYEVYRQIRVRIIEIENQYKLGDHYPWQPWTFTPGSNEYRIATAFAREMLDLEAEFLALDPEGRRQWMADFKWRW